MDTTTTAATVNQKENVSPNVATGDQQQESVKVSEAKSTVTPKKNQKNKSGRKVSQSRWVPKSGQKKPAENSEVTASF